MKIEIEVGANERRSTYEIQPNSLGATLFLRDTGETEIERLGFSAQDDFSVCRGRAASDSDLHLGSCRIRGRVSSQLPRPSGCRSPARVLEDCGTHAIPEETHTAERTDEGNLRPRCSVV